ncbi:MAG TPA: hypothetical protein DCE71_01165 [Parachlamydiales bacterium]|nr:hypothetical protein [Parachlamydiales bacterium]
MGAFQHVDSERETIAGGDSASENQNLEAKLMWTRNDFSSCFGIYRNNPGCGNLQEKRIDMIEKGKKASVEYTVFLADGTQIDSNVGEAPLVVVVGSHQVFPALEEALLGLRAGDEKQVHLQPEQAYGPIVQEAFKEVDLDAVPDSFRYVGAVLGIQDPAGGVFPIRVHQINENKAVLDFNHPLAGQSLRFDMKVIEVR